MTAHIWHLFGLTMPMSRAVEVPDGSSNILLSTTAIERLPTEPVGSTFVTFSGVNANSEIRVYLPDGTEVAGVEDCVANQVLSWGVYATGSANNTVTIRIVHFAYEIKEFDYASSAGARDLPVQQKVDKWARNPA